MSQGTLIIRCHVVPLFLKGCHSYWQHHGCKWSTLSLMICHFSTHVGCMVLWSPCSFMVIVVIREILEAPDFSSALKITFLGLLVVIGYRWVFLKFNGSRKQNQKSRDCPTLTKCMCKVGFVDTLSLPPIGPYWNDGRVAGLDENLQSWGPSQ